MMMHALNPCALRVQLCGGKGYEEDGDVVGAAAGVSGLDKLFAGGVEAGFGGGRGGLAEDGGDLGVGELAGEAV